MTRVTKPFSSTEVANASAYLKDLQHITKPMVAMNTKIRDALLTVIIGTEDKFNLIPISIEINEKYEQYYSIIAASMSGDSKRSAVPIDCIERLQIATDLTILAQALSEAISKNTQATFTTKYNAVAAFFPAPEFATIGEEPSSATTYKNEADLKFSRVADKISLSGLKTRVISDIPEYEPCAKNSNFEDEDIVQDDQEASPLLSAGKVLELSTLNKQGFPLIAVTPPSTGEAYSYLNNTFNNAGFLLQALRSNSASAWSKYTNGRSVPSSITWGMLLLAIGIHPAYKLVQRKDVASYLKSDLFKDIHPNWENIFDTDVWSYFRDRDLMPYEVEQVPVHEKVDYAAMRELLFTKIFEWFRDNPNGEILGHTDPMELTVKIGILHSGSANNIEMSREINKIILDLSKNKAFDQKITRKFIAAYAPPHEFSPELDNDIFKLSRVAFFLHFDANPCPNVMAMFRYLPDRTGDVSLISQLTGISPETWARYEQGTRIPYSAAWTSILLSLDLHPIYRLENRKDEEELLLAYRIYKDLHFSVSQKSKDFKIPPNSSFEYFKNAVI